jgi:hypothetical protein
MKVFQAFLFLYLYMLVISIDAAGVLFNIDTGLVIDCRTCPIQIFV